MYELILPVRLHMGLTPIEMKEILYQSTAYVGAGTTLPFFKVLNNFLVEENINVPIESQRTVTDESRRAESGNAKQVELFGPQMKNFLKSAPAERAHVNFYLASHCFGDFYTRTGLDNKQREMVTFCYIAALGSCHPQLLSHTQANFKVGNDKEFMIEVVSQMIPYLGYPRSLNALNTIDEAAQN